MKSSPTRLERVSARFVEAMTRAFPRATQTATWSGLPRFSIAPLVPEFGPLVVEVEPDAELTLVVGTLMHTHFGGASAVDELIATCRKLLEDELVIAVFAGGASMSPREYVDFTADAAFWVWSGRVDPRRFSTE